MKKANLILFAFTTLLPLYGYFFLDWVAELVIASFVLEFIIMSILSIFNLFKRKYYLIEIFIFLLISVLSTTSLVSVLNFKPTQYLPELAFITIFVIFSQILQLYINSTVYRNRTYEAAGLIVVLLIVVGGVSNPETDLDVIFIVFIWFKLIFSIYLHKTDFGLEKVKPPAPIKP